MNANKLQITPELMHNWPRHESVIKYPVLPDNVKSAMRLQHKEHSRGLSVRESAKKVCSRFPKYLEMRF